MGKLTCPMSSPPTTTGLLSAFQTASVPSPAAVAEQATRKSATMSELRNA
jgi:hypothetical protein